MYEEDRKRGPVIGNVSASIDFPKNWSGDKTVFAEISMTTRKFNIKLKEFIKDLEDFKRGKIPAKEL